MTLFQKIQTLMTEGYEVMNNTAPLIIYSVFDKENVPYFSSTSIKATSSQQKKANTMNQKE